MSEIVIKTAHINEEADWRGYLTKEDREEMLKAGNLVVRSRRIIGRGMRRKLVAEWTGQTRESLIFSEGNNEKPRAVGVGKVDFNISHSGEYVAIAVGERSVGIDIEQIRDVREMESVVARYFFPDEVAAWQKLEKSQQTEGFFILWCAREAAMKCVGLGLAGGIALTRVNPQILLGREAEASVAGRSLRVWRQEAPQGYVMILASEA